MTIVNDRLHVSAINYKAMEPEIKQSEIKTESQTNYISGSDTELLNELLNQLLTPSSDNKLESIRQCFIRHGVNISNDNGKNKLTDLLGRLQTENDNLQSLDSVAEIVANQERKRRKTEQTLSDIQREILNIRAKTKYSVSQFNAEKLKALQLVSLQEANNSGKASSGSYAELWDKVSEAISSIQEDYVDFYANLLQKYTEMYEAFNKYIQAAAAAAVSAGDDGNNVTFNGQAMMAAYAKFKILIINTDLGSVKNWDKMTAAEREKVLTTLQPAFKVSNNGKIEFNLDQYNSMPNYPTGANSFGNGKVSSAAYQAWLASFNAVSSAFQSNMQAFGQRYSQASATFDNLNKVLSSTIAALAESAREVLKSIA